jgi:hypothetical protein
MPMHVCTHIHMYIHTPLTHTRAQDGGTCFRSGVSTVTAGVNVVRHIRIHTHTHTHTHIYLLRIHRLKMAVLWRAYSHCRCECSWPYMYTHTHIHTYIYDAYTGSRWWYMLPVWRAYSHCRCECSWDPRGGAGQLYNRLPT